MAKKPTQIKYRQLVKAVIEAQFCNTPDEAEKYIIGTIQSLRFMRGAGLVTTSNFKNTKNRKLVKLINALEVREAKVNKQTSQSETIILCEDYEVL